MVTTQKNSKMQSIEAARALAAIAVALMHCANAMRVENFSKHVGLNSFFDFGYVGVDFFFVLSGFIITYVHFKDIGKPEKLPVYLWRRLTRIYPIFWIFLSIAIMVVTLGRLATDNGLLLDMGVNDIASTVFLIIGEGEPKYIGPAWSLQFELLFYVIFCGLLINGRIGGLLMIGWAAILLGQIFDLFQLSLPYGIGSPFCVEFLSGVAVGLLARKYPLSASKSMLGWALLAFMAGVVFDVYGPLGRHTGIGRLVLGLASALILTVLVGLENRRALRTPSWLVRIGSVSYSIYLGHILFINMTFMILLKLGIYHALPEIVVFSIGLGVALTLTILIGLHVEIPVVNRLKNYKAAVKAG